MPSEPQITDPPPADVATELEALRLALDSAIPAKQLDRNLLIGTWNIRAFGDLTQKWHSGTGDSPKRDLHALRLIAEVVSRFDVVALQEVRENIKALRHMLRVLGPDWGLILTDENKQPQGNDERLAFVFDTRRVKASGLACELVVPVESDPAKIKPDALNRQFARSPYAVSFLTAGVTFILVTLHVLWGKKSQERIGELTAIAEWLSGWAKRMNEWEHNFIALGDFNIDRVNDPLYQAFISTGLTPPPELNHVPRTIFQDPGEGHFYDQVAWFTGVGGVPALSLRYTGRAGGFDFTQSAMTDLTKQEIAWRMSDHYPLWVEFGLS